jgi:hypothetical protein
MRKLQLTRVDGIWTLKENGRIKLTHESYNEICRGINSLVRAYEEHKVQHQLEVVAA